MRFANIFARQISLVAGCLLLTACPHKSPVPPTPSTNNIGETDYVDLKAGWRIRVITPIMSSGGYIVPMTTKVEGNVITVTTGKNFLGYQTDYYDVQSSNDGMVRVRFNHGEAVVQGKKTKRTQPALQLPPQTSDQGFFRLVYLIRVSQHDHGMVLLASTQKDSLHDLTNSVVTDGLNNCRVSKNSSCAGIPKGVGFILEEKVRKNGQTQWISAR